MRCHRRLPPHTCRLPPHTSHPPKPHFPLPQVYGGVVFMDFEKARYKRKGYGRYEPLPPEMLPRLCASPPAHRRRPLRRAAPRRAAAGRWHAQAARAFDVPANAPRAPRPYPTSLHTSSPSAPLHPGG